MLRILSSPSRVAALGTPPKVIEEFVGRVNSGTAQVSVARMKSPSGWSEPVQQPEFDEYTIVLAGMLRVTAHHSVADVHAGQAIIVSAGERVQYSTPGPDGAEYIAVCLPAFAPGLAHREDAPA